MSVRVDIRVPEQVLKRIDSVAKRGGQTRTQVLLAPWLQDGETVGKVEPAVQERPRVPPPRAHLFDPATCQHPKDRRKQVAGRSRCQDCGYLFP